MSSPHLVEVNELSPEKLCNYIDKKHYTPAIQIIEGISKAITDLQVIEDSNGQIELIAVLFYRIKDEVMQLIRNDRLIIFPLIRNDGGVTPCKGRKLPLEMIHNMNKKIIHLLDRLRHMLNNYIAKPEWTQDFRVICDELHEMDQQVMQAIYLKENVLLPKVAFLFNQPCQKDCNHH
jgi:iron-sulfur cluster repair protein YtfE (RIC family)